MKKINATIIIMLICAIALAQETRISSVADVTIPKGAEKFTKEKMLNRSKMLFKSSEMGYSETNIFFVKDNISFAFWDLTAPVEKRSLETIQREILELFKLNKNITVENANIKTINNKKFLILSYTNYDACYYRFFSDSWKNKTINGIVEYKQPDKAKAEAILNKILDGLNFK
jgi:hypothetical protein